MSVRVTSPTKGYEAPAISLAVMFSLAKVKSTQRRSQQSS